MYFISTFKFELVVGGGGRRIEIESRLDYVASIAFYLIQTTTHI